MTSRSPFLKAATTAAVLFLFTLAFAYPVSADPFGVKLTRPDSLAGWDYGMPAPSGWSMVDGVLSGSDKSTPLLSGFTAGDFELRFKWSVGDGGAIRILMPKVPRGTGLELVLCEGSGCGRLSEGGKTLSSGGVVQPLTEKGALHSAAIKRRGKKLLLSIDGKQLYEVEIPADRYGLGLAISKGNGKLADIRGCEPLGKPMITGKTLPNWESEDKKAWRLEGEELVLKPDKWKYLCTKKDYANFVVSFKYKLQSRGNSGMAIRTPRGGWPSGDGLELQIYDRPDLPMDEHSQMSIYGNVPPLAWSDKAGQWNDVVIKADGWMISAWVNGELVQQYNTLHHPELKHRHLKGWIGMQDHKNWVRYRDLRILEAPDGTGLDAWNKPKPLTAAMTMVDRLMNSESVSKTDGITSGVVKKTLARKAAKNGKATEQVIADLRGPGAVVRVAYWGQQGRLAFYFDDEKKPRLECAPNKLWKNVPHLNNDMAPVLSYVPYKKSLKIVLRGLRDVKKGRYVIDYVNFPAGLQVETFSGAATSIPRGWLEPPLYRQHVINWGVHRDFDPQLRVVSRKKNIASGKSVQLAKVDGAGLVRWVKLLADSKTLNNDDLWLCVTIDGETKPAISAPARFWFPGFANGGGNYYNYLLVSREGATNMLAMPFGNGLSLSAENHGKKTIADVGIDLSIEKATDKTRADIVGRARLRGLFLPGGSGSNVIFSQTGKGRWVGLVLQIPEKDPVLAKANVFVDGKALEGYKNLTLDDYLGRSGREYRKCLSGRRQGLAWRYMLMAPVDFQESIRMEATTNELCKRLALFYVKN
ncbi:MAG: DUF1080 domain-containing protein [Pirellulales bacterium]|nr:DUF1080 domain-containing protein [Pirellulales bacterium]